jgi:hypothetical protein
MNENGITFGTLEKLAQAQGISLASALFSIATEEQLTRIANSLK